MPSGSGERDPVSRRRRWLGLALLAAAAPRGLTAQTADSGSAAPALASITVRLGERVRTVPMLTHPEGGIAVRVDQLATALGGIMLPLDEAGAHTRVEIGATMVDLRAGTSVAIVGADTVPLPGMVYRDEGFLYVPVTLATDVLPRSGSGVLFDPERMELRRFVMMTVAKGGLPGEAAAASVAAASPAPPPLPASPLPALTRRRTVVVDAGHGGPDDGMRGPLGASVKVSEKQITLAVARELQRALETRGVGVVMTRTTDTLIALADRGRMANQAKGDLFVSIHVNAANPRWANAAGARGFETYFLAEAKTEDERRVEAMENEAVKFEAAVETSRDDPLGFIIRDMAQNEHLRESSRLAAAIQGGLRTVHPGADRGVKQAGFRVLVSAFMPAVLVEIGFGSNRADSAWLTSPGGQSEMAAAIADAVVRYLADYERKVGTP